MRISTAAMLVLLATLTFMPAESSEITTIGAVEDILLMPWGVKLQARIDTGAALSSIDACDIKMEGAYVSFSLADRCGGYRVRSKLLKLKEVRSSEGKDIRPVVMMDFCLGPHRIRSRVTRNDRSAIESPVLIGRNTLKKRFMVDVSRKHLAPPSCVNLFPGLAPSGATDRRMSPPAP